MVRRNSTTPRSRSSSRIARESGDFWRRLRWLAESAADPNDIDRIEDDAEGLCFTPLSTRDGRRFGSRERVLDVVRLDRGAHERDVRVAELDQLAVAHLRVEPVRVVPPRHDIGMLEQCEQERLVGATAVDDDLGLGEGAGEPRPRLVAVAAPGSWPLCM